MICGKLWQTGRQAGSLSLGLETFAIITATATIIINSPLLGDGAQALVVHDTQSHFPLGIVKRNMLFFIFVFLFKLKHQNMDATRFVFYISWRIQGRTLKQPAKTSSRPFSTHWNECIAHAVIFFSLSLLIIVNREGLSCLPSPPKEPSKKVSHVTA